MFMKNSKDIVFLHLTDLPNCGCVFCLARDKNTGKTKMYLVAEGQDAIYSRESVTEAWMKLEDPQDYLNIKESFVEAVEARNVPCFCE